VLQAAVANTYPTSSDTYVDFSYNGLLTYSSVANGASAPAVAADSLRLEKVVTDATAITGVTQVASTTLGVTATSVLLPHIVRATDIYAPWLPNLLDNPGFIPGFSGWGMVGKWAVNTAGGYPSAFAQSAGQTSADSPSTLTSARLLTIINTEICVSAFVQSVNGTVTLAVNAYTSGGSLISTIATAESSGVNGLKFVSANGTVPSNASYLQLIITATPTSTSAAYLDVLMPKVEYNSYPTAYQAGDSLQSSYSDGTQAPYFQAALTAASVGNTSTAGAYTISAASLASLYFVDNATQTAAATLTTDTAANLWAAFGAGPAVGASFTFRIFNDDQSATGYPITLAGGTGVTIGTTLPNPAIAKGAWADFLFTFTGSSAVTVRYIGQGTI
jgi:hypothetical protein